MSDDGSGALWISPGSSPNMTEIETALESGPFVLTSDSVMVTCKPSRWVVKEVTDSVCELLLLFKLTGPTGPAAAQAPVHSCR